MSNGANVVDINPDVARKGGGLLEEGTIEVTRACYEMSDKVVGAETYNKALPEPVPLLVWYGKDPDTNEDWEPPFFWPTGNPKDFQPAPGGDTLITLNAAYTTLQDNTNMILLLTSIVNAGWDKNRRFTPNASQFAGGVFHLIRVPDPRFKDQKKLSKGKEYTQSLMIVDKVIRLPWEKGKAAGAGAPAGKSAATMIQQPAADADTMLMIDIEIGPMIEEIIKEKGGSVPKRSLLSALAAKLGAGTMAEKAPKINRANDDTWLGQQDGWTYADGVLKAK